ncbi:hypothetical protein EAE96_008065 [Botrytis aclada]|nr:hypothetical protein EAE96_008065 [Botrytis aclada]
MRSLPLTIKEKAKKARDNGSSSIFGHDKNGLYKGSKPRTLTASNEPPKLISDTDFVAKSPVRSNKQRLLKGEFSAERGFAAAESLNVSWKHHDVNEAEVPQGEEISKSKSKSKRPKDPESRAPRRTPTSVENVKTLKLHYLRTRSHDDAYAIIHGRPLRAGTGNYAQNVFHRANPLFLENLCDLTGERWMKTANAVAIRRSNIFRSWGV